MIASNEDVHRVIDEDFAAQQKSFEDGGCVARYYWDMEQTDNLFEI